MRLPAAWNSGYGRNGKSTAAIRKRKSKCCGRAAAGRGRNKSADGGRRSSGGVAQGAAGGQDLFQSAAATSGAAGPGRGGPAGAGNCHHAGSNSDRQRTAGGSAASAGPVEKPGVWQRLNPVHWFHSSTPEKKYDENGVTPLPPPGSSEAVNPTPLLPRKPGHRPFRRRRRVRHRSLKPNRLKLSGLRHRRFRGICICRRTNQNRATGGRQRARSRGPGNLSRKRAGWTP